METPLNQDQADNILPEPSRPQFLKVLCILSYVAFGLLFMIYGLGLLCLGIDETKANEIWDKFIEGFPDLTNVDAVVFFHKVGIYSLINLLVNIVSLVGVVMMWKLDKKGFYIYLLAELGSNFIPLGVEMGNESKSYGGLIFSIVLDLVFIGMYYVNIRRFNKEEVIRG